MLRSALYKATYTIVFFLANLLLANLILPEHFGTISLMIVNASVFYLLTNMGADSIIMHSVNSGKWNLVQATSFTANLFGVQLVFFLLLELGHINLWSSTLLVQQNNAFLFGEILYFTGLILTEKFLLLHYAEHNAVVANRILLLTAAFYIAVLAYARLVHVASFSLLFHLFCLQSFVQGCLLLIAFFWNGTVRRFAAIGLRTLFALFKSSAVVMVTNLLQLLAYRIDFLLIKKFYSAYEVGIYAQVNKFANLMWVIPNIFAFLLMPKFRKIDAGKIPLVFRYALFSGIALLFATVIITVVFYNYFIVIAYRNGLPSFYLMLPGYFCWSIVIYFGAYFSWLGKFKYNLLVSSICFVSILLCDLLLIPKFSINGAAIANTIAYSTTLVVCMLLFSRVSGTSVIKIFHPQKDDLAFLFKLLK